MAAVRLESVVIFLIIFAALNIGGIVGYFFGRSMSDQQLLSHGYHLGWSAAIDATTDNDL